jgi:assimilatory nitrate reductase catalytic subunit
LLTEDYYVFNKLVKGLLGTNNLDTNSRLCMSSAVAGYKATLGADAPPACYEDIDLAGCMFITGSNMAWAHPILFRRVEEARARNPQLRIIVADPRRTETAELADLYLPLQPGSDVMLFHGLLHIMLWEGWTDSAFIAQHTSGFAALKELVREATPEKVAAICGLPVADLYRAARWMALGGAEEPADARRPTLSLYCQGLNQSRSGTANNAALINLHLATGQIGRPGAGPLSLTGQPNAMGGREVGGLSNLLSAHRDLANAEHRAEVARLWGWSRFRAARQVRAGDVRGRCRRPDQGLVDCLHQSRAEHARTGHGAQGAGACRAGGGAGGFCRDRDHGLCRLVAACLHLGREAGHGHEQRAAHLAGARCRGRTGGGTP